MCKKIVMFLFAIAFISSLFGVSQALAQEEYEGPLTFKMLTYRNGYEVTSCEKDAIEVVIPETYKGRPVYEIGRSAFEDCSELTSVVIPDTVDTISSYAFWNCESLTGIVIPDSVKYIYGDAFSDCTSLKEVKLSENLTELNNIFWNCVSLESIHIPARVYSISSREFGECISLKEITVDPDNPYYYSEDNCIIDRFTNVLVKGCGTSVIPYGVTAIGEHAFRFARGMENVVIPDTVTQIGKFAFYNTEISGTLTVPGSVSVLPEDVFNDAKINVLVVSEGVTTFEFGAFTAAQINKLTLPASLENIYDLFGGDLQVYGQPPVIIYYVAGSYAEEFLKPYRSWRDITLAELIYNSGDTESSAPVDEQDFSKETDNAYRTVTAVSAAVIILCTAISVTVIKKQK